MYAVGIDLGGTRIKIGLINEGAVIDKHIIDTNSKRFLSAHLKGIENSIQSLISKNNIDYSEIGGIGFAFSGLVDTDKNQVLSTNEKYTDAKDVVLVDWAKEKFNIPLYLENDARMALLGEWKYGKGKNCDNLSVITLGTGIGTATLISGKLLRGKHYQAGCLGGHFIVDYKGNKCSCGNIGCVEAEASSCVINNLVQSKKIDISQSLLSKYKEIDVKAIFMCAKENDEIAIKIRNYCLDIWSAAIINLIHAYDSERVVIGGGIAESHEVILPYITDRIHNLAWTPWGLPEIVASKNFDSAALKGAYYLVENKGKIEVI